MLNPCDKCKKRGKCPPVCYPKRDYERAMNKKGRRGTGTSVTAKAKM